MKKKYILLIFLFSIFLIFSLLIIYGLTYRPKPIQTLINPEGKTSSPICQKTPISCQTNEDCKICADNEEMECVEINRYTPEQEKIYGKSGKFCLLPLPANKDCNSKLGGIWTWTGWSFLDRMEWDCLCTYPEIAGGPGCMTKNANVCNGGTYNYDATTFKRGPKPTDCECGSGKHLLVPNEQSTIPLCIENAPYLCKDKKMCESMYSNSTFIK